MNKKLTFAKLANKWYIILPEYKGDIEELEMVAGADLLLETLSKGNPTIQVKVSTEPLKDGIELYLFGLDDIGATYNCESNEFSGNIWLCNVTKYVLGNFPNIIYFKTIL